MGISERKAREREERKALIKEKAKSLLLERGVEALSVQAIADAAELSKAGIYLYFDTRERILLEILDDSTDRFVRFARDRIGQERSGREILRRLWSCFRDFYGTADELFVLPAIRAYIDPYVAPENAPPDRPEQDPAFKMRGLIGDAIAAGIADGTLGGRVDAVEAARYLLFLITAIIDNAAALPADKRDLGRVMEEIRKACDLLLRGMLRDRDSELPLF